MQYKEWKIWFKSKPWYFKLIILIIVLRPIIDNFYYLKHLSPILSPLYWAGVLSVLLSVWGISQKRKLYTSPLDLLFKIFGVLLFISVFFMMIYYGFLNLLSIQILFKYSILVLLFFFFRRFINSQYELQGVLQANLYASFIAFGFLIYEIIFGGIRVEYTRGVERIQANFADVLNYAGYFIIACIVVSYNFFITKSKGASKSSLLLAFTYVLVSFGLFKINHLTSIITALIILFLFIVYNFRLNKFFALVIIIILAIIGNSQMVRDTFESNVNPLIETDLAVMEGDLSEERLFHGRYGRWKDVIETFQELEIVPMVFGYPYSFQEDAAFYTSGVHNDFIRILMLTGVLGFIIYLLILFHVFFKKTTSVPSNFLKQATIIMLVVYSITTVPTLYANFLYFILPVFAYFSLPKSRM